MAVKHFLLNPNKNPLSKESLSSIRESKEKALLDGDDKRFSLNEKILSEDDDLKYIEGRVVIKIDDKSKDSHTFTNGFKIRLERRFNNFNLRETNPVNCHVISSSYIEKGSEILVDYHSIHDSNRIYNYKSNTSDIGYYSIKEEDCFAYYKDGAWCPMEGFDFGLRIFKPYEGLISGIEPTLLKDYLFVTTGKLKGKVVKTLIACDYEIIFQDKNGQEGSLIRFRPFGDEKRKMEWEAVYIDHLLTQDVSNGKILIGYTIKDARRREHFSMY